MKLYRVLSEKPILVVAIVILLISFLDFSNIDSVIYKFTCTLISPPFLTVCPDYYDLPIWETATSVGTLSALYFAYRAIRQSNIQLEAEQTPYVVMKSNIGMATIEGQSRMHIVMFENIGRGLASNITLTSDPEGQVSIIDGTNPHSVNLGSGQFNNGWAIDETEVILGLKKQGLKIKSSVIKDIPDENKVADTNLSDFHLFFWYSDQVGKKYKTIAKIRHSGSFLKVMENQVVKLF